MFKEEDGDSLRVELGLTDKRSNELVNIVQTMMDKEAPGGEYGRTSHVLLGIAGRKDLTEVEKVACTFLFACRMVIDQPKAPSMRASEERERRPRIFSNMPPGIPPGIPNPFIDIGGGVAGMIVAPEGVDKHELITVLMASVTSLLREMPKHDAQDFCRYASMSFTRMALTGDFKLL